MGTGNMPGDERFREADRILDAALDIPVDQRAAFLDRECGADGDLRRLVERLLAGAESGSQWLVPGEGFGPPASGTAAHAARADDLNEPIGPYVLRERIGTGGFGDVYLADQMQPVRRRVALKILKAGMDTRSVLLRFEAEGQALALMDHPNIAKVFDAGETKRGLPFFAMEYVPGLPLNEYCDRQRLTTRERLELLLPVCRAVQHAHGKGIIHRDLKPTNILVTIADGEPTPKVIDFGIAKATTASLTEATLHTLQGQIMGTPAYMSPEQVHGGGLDVDTRTDVYSLGVVLYELLTGVQPHDPETLRQVGFDTMQRIIMEETPPSPSARVTEMEDGSAHAAGRRRTEPMMLRRQLRGELDWITMKALEKDRTRRYETASALARDISRFLNDEAVEAGPPSTVYRMRKFARRHKVAFGAAATVFVGVLVAAAGLTYALVESNRQRALVETALRETQEARAAAEAVTTFVTDMLGAPVPSKEGRDITVVEVLDAASSAIAREFGAAPAIEARVRETLGVTYGELGEFDPAVEHLERAVELHRGQLGDDDRITLGARRELATAHRDRGDLDVAETILRDVLQREEAAFGVGDSATAFTLDQLGTVLTLGGRYEDAERIQARADDVGKAAFGERDPRRAKIRANLGVLYRVLGRLDESREALSSSLEILRTHWGEEDPNTMNVVANLVNVHYQLGDFEEAVVRGRELVATKERVLGEEHPSALQTKSDLASALNRAGHPAEAESLGTVILGARRRLLGPEHPSTLQSMNNLAMVYWRVGEPERAEPLFREALDIKLRVLGAEHLDTIITQGNYGALLTEMGRPGEGLPPLRAAYASAEKSLPEDHAYRNDVLRKLGECLHALGRREEAEAALLEAHAKLEAKAGADFTPTRRAAKALGNLYEEWGRPDDAAAWRAKLPADDS